jgi:hypothetical protein
MERFEVAVSFVDRVVKKDRNYSSGFVAKELGERQTKPSAARKTQVPTFRRYHKAIERTMEKPLNGAKAEQIPAAREFAGGRVEPGRSAGRNVWARRCPD